MVVSDPAAVVADLDSRRARLRRRRRRHAVREWAGLAAVALACIWLAGLAVMTLMGR